MSYRYRSLVIKWYKSLRSWALTLRISNVGNQKNTNDHLGMVQKPLIKNCWWLGDALLLFWQNHVRCRRSFPTMGVPPNHPLKKRMFHEINHPAIGVPPWLWWYPYIQLLVPPWLWWYPFKCCNRFFPHPQRSVTLPSGQVQPAGFRRVLHGTGIHYADLRGVQGVDQGVAVHGQLAHHVLLDRAAWPPGV